MAERAASPIQKVLRLGPSIVISDVINRRVHRAISINAPNQRPTSGLEGEDRPCRWLTIKAAFDCECSGGPCCRSPRKSAGGLVSCLIGLAPILP